METIFEHGTYMNKQTGVELDFSCVTNPSISTKQDIVNRVVNAVVDDNYYHSLITDMITKFMIVVELTDIDISAIKDGNYNIEAIESFLDANTIYDETEKIVGQDVVEEIKNAINLGIEYKTGIHKNPVAESLSALIDNINGMIGAVSPDEMAEFVHRVNAMDDSITADKIAEAYANSPAVKQMHQDTNDKWDKRNEKLIELLNEKK